MKLDDLDDRLVPRLAAKLRGLLDGVGAARRDARRRWETLSDGPLQRLDDRFASSGPLALMRELPQLALLLLAVLFVTGSGVALARSGAPQPMDAAQRQVDAPDPTALGAPIGTVISEYVAENRARAASLSQRTPDQEYDALVSFRTYLTPERVRITLGDLDVKKVVVRAKLPADQESAEVLPIPVVNLVQDVRTFAAALAKRKLVDAKELTGLASSITGTSKDELEFKAFYKASAAAAQREAAVYRGSCVCVIGALVRGTARDLAELQAVATVRAVQVGGRGPADDVELTPLLPEQLSVVSKLATPPRG